MKKYINTIGHLVVVVSVIFILFKLIRYFSDIPTFTWGIWSGLSLFSAIIFCALNVGVGAYIWALFLRCGGVHLSLRPAFIIYGYSQIAKYFPGNILHFLGRIGLGRKAGIPTEAIVLSMGVETLLFSLTAAIIGAVGLSINNKSLVYIILRQKSNELTIISLVTISLILILTFSVILFPRLKDWIRQRSVYFHPKRIGASILLCTISFILYGMFISLLMSTLWGLNSDFKWYQFTWGFALAWFLGFIVPGAPGGIGIREVVFFELYAQELGEGVVLGLALVIRVFTILGDLLAFSVAYLINRKKNLFQEKEK